MCSSLRNNNPHPSLLTEDGDYPPEPNIMELKSLNKNYCLADLLEAEGIKDATVNFMQTPNTKSVIAIADNVDLCFCQKSIWDKAKEMSQEQRRNLRILEGEKGWVAIEPQSRGDF